MATHQIGNNVELGYIDKRRFYTNDLNSKTTLGIAMFTANAAGTTTTLVGANAAPGTDDTNVVRRNEEFRLFTSAGVLKEEKVFTITGIAAAVSTTVTFSPAAAVATASGDIARRVTADNFLDHANMDARLLVLNYTQANIDRMTENDKIYAIRLADDPGGI